jgi:dTDP-3-amino-3,4,6-trideoxy-alpha-D-glucose transaminase
MVDLRPMLAETEPVWRAHLARLFAQMQFVLGEQVAAFESELAAAWGARFAVTVGSGTAAIELGLRAAGLGESGAQVIVPALTSLFTAQAVLAAGCRPRFADVDPVHLLLEPASAEAQCGPRARAIVPVHLYGQPCDMGGFGEMARRRDLAIVQDACQANGARSADKPLTRFSPAVAYSFYPTKNLPCLGDGGAVLTDSVRVAAALRRLRDGGRNGDQVARVRAVNSRLDEMQACYLRAFLGRLEEWNTRRVRLARLYDEALADCRAVTPVPRRAGSVCHLYVVRARRRTQVREHLGRHGIVSGVHYPAPLNLQPAFRDGWKRGDFPVAERACREVLSLPLWPHLAESAVAEVAERIREL